MTKRTKVLIVEDEPLIIGVLERALHTLSQSNGLMNFDVKATIDCDTALFEIKKAINTIPFDLVLLDINIPPSKDKSMLSGEDLGIEIKGYFPKVKIMVLTNHSDNFRLSNILRSLNPEGFIIKTEIDFDPLIAAIQRVLSDAPFYSTKIIQLMRKQIVNDFALDTIDRQLLYQISKGAKTKDLIELVNLSKSAIELRKRNLKIRFGIEESNDRILIAKAEQHGFV